MSQYKGYELQEKDGDIAVLYSPGFGAGWSTWNNESLAYDKRVVELFDNNPPPLDEDHLNTVQKALKEYGYGQPYLGGYEQLIKEWIPKNQPFRIHEYDGSENIQYLDEIGLICFT